MYNYYERNIINWGSERKKTRFFQKFSYTADTLHKTTSQIGLSFPYLDSELLAVYFKHLSSRGIIQRTRQRKSLDDKVAIVTGASSGIGKAIATAMAEAGAKVSMAARRTNKLQEVQTAIANSGGVPISVKELVRHTEATLGPVDILVNNAGTMYYTMMKNIHEDEWDTQIDVNIKARSNKLHCRCARRNGPAAKRTHH
ncbi:Y2567-like protein [Mya arenaria]|uniref:Y2567-like protein n=1 Tax=Mya arenaria TaxID=6604 RepID=A0ABY7DMQ2_MYAAR|nr:Y2567-like protein [Mya arenaria]